MLLAFNDLYLGWNVTAYNLHSFLPDYMKVVVRVLHF
jgi:hypothetical protein